MSKCCRYIKFFWYNYFGFEFFLLSRIYFLLYSANNNLIKIFTLNLSYISGSKKPSFKVNFSSFYSISSFRIIDLNIDFKRFSRANDIVIDRNWSSNSSKRSEKTSSYISFIFVFWKCWLIQRNFNDIHR